MTGYTSDFDWSPRNDTDHSIVVRHQPAIAVYLNPHDEVVIRQQDQYDESQDGFVFITKDNVLKVVERMLAIAGIEAMAGQDWRQKRDVAGGEEFHLSSPDVRFQYS